MTAPDDISGADLARRLGIRSQTALAMKRTAELALALDDEAEMEAIRRKARALIAMYEKSEPR